MITARPIGTAMKGTIIRIENNDPKFLGSKQMDISRDEAEVLSDRLDDLIEQIDEMEPAVAGCNCDACEEERRVLFEKRRLDIYYPIQPMPPNPDPFTPKINELVAAVNELLRAKG
jgi:hypothetical protein